MKWGIVVVAGGLAEEKLAVAIGTARKALAVIEGRTCLRRVLEAVQGTGLERVVVVSGPDVAGEVVYGRLILEGKGQVDNARLGLEAVGEVDAVLFLPADAPYLTPEVLTQFMQAVDERATEGPWYAVGMCDHPAFRVKYPKMETVPVRLKDGNYLTGALYATTPEGFYKGISLFEEVSHDRRSQLRLVFRLGLRKLFKYLTHRLSIKEALEAIERVVPGKVILVMGCDPCMAVDIDEAHDYEALTS